MFVLGGARAEPGGRDSAQARAGAARGRAPLAAGRSPALRAERRAGARACRRSSSPPTLPQVH